MEDPWTACPDTENCCLIWHTVHMTAQMTSCNAQMVILLGLFFQIYGKYKKDHKSTHLLTLKKQTLFAWRCLEAEQHPELLSLRLEALQHPLVEHAAEDDNAQVGQSQHLTMVASKFYMFWVCSEAASFSTLRTFWDSVKQWKTEQAKCRPS